MEYKSETGATRTAKYTGDQPDHWSKRFDLMLANRPGLEAIALAFGEGMLKYGRDNWKKGFHESVLLQHTLDHLIEYVGSNREEDHLGHALLNLFTLCWMREHKPELLDVTGADPGPARELYDQIIALKEKANVRKS